MHILYAPDRRITPKLRSFINFAVVRFGRVLGGAGRGPFHIGAHATEASALTEPRSPAPKVWVALMP
jgi:hypothetical protein